MNFAQAHIRCESDSAGIAKPSADKAKMSTNRAGKAWSFRAEVKGHVSQAEGDHLTCFLHPIRASEIDPG